MIEKLEALFLKHFPNGIEDINPVDFPVNANRSITIIDENTPEAFNLTPSKGRITDKETGEVYNIAVEFKTIYQTRWRDGKVITYTGAFFEVD